MGEISSPFSLPMMKPATSEDANRVLAEIKRQTSNIKHSVAVREGLCSRAIQN